MTKNTDLRTTLALTLAILFWGLSFVATKIALQSFPPFCIMFFRFATAAIFFAILLLRSGFPAPTARNLRNLALLAVFEPFLYFIFETFGLEYASATTTSLLIATIPLVVLFLSAVFLRERVSWLQLVGIAISLAGVGLLVFGAAGDAAGGNRLLGDLLIVGAVLSAAIYMIIVRQLGQTMNTLQITGMQIIFGALLFLPAFLHDLPRLHWQQVRPDAVIALVALTIFATIAAFFCYNYALSKVPAASAAICINGIPVVTAAGAWLLLGETLTPLQLVGGGIVLFAVYLANSARARGGAQTAGAKTEIPLTGNAG